MYANDERTRQMTTARKNKLRNLEKEQDSPDRAKPKARSEPEPNPISTPPVNDAPKKQMLQILYRKTKIKYDVKTKKHIIIQNPNMSQKDEEEDQQTHLLKQKRVEIPNMTPNGAS